jgi:hypothetical protein
MDDQAASTGALGFVGRIAVLIGEMRQAVGQCGGPVLGADGGRLATAAQRLDQAMLDGRLTPPIYLDLIKQVEQFGHGQRVERQLRHLVARRPKARPSGLRRGHGPRPTSE